VHFRPFGVVSLKATKVTGVADRIHYERDATASTLMPYSIFLEVSNLGLPLFGVRQKLRRSRGFSEGFVEAKGGSERGSRALTQET
jgi:hypothetical protein